MQISQFKVRGGAFKHRKDILELSILQRLLAIAQNTWTLLISFIFMDKMPSIPQNEHYLTLLSWLLDALSTQFWQQYWISSNSSVYSSPWKHFSWKRLKHSLQWINRFELSKLLPKHPRQAEARTSTFVFVFFLFLFFMNFLNYFLLGIIKEEGGSYSGLASRNCW